MREAAKIAVVRAPDRALVDGLRALAGPPEVREFGSYYDDFEQIREFSPALMLVPCATLVEADVGVLRLLRQTIGRLVLVVVVPREREVEVDGIARRVEAHLLLTPFRPQDLAAIASLGDGPSQVATPDTFLDLVKGIADEINNPLLFASGHLQLLEAAIAPAATAQLEQVASIREGFARIGETVDKVQLLSRARSMPPATEWLALGDVLAAALAATAGHERLTVDLPPELAEVTVLGDARLLPAALEHLLAVGTELATRCQAVAVKARKLERGLRIRIELRGLELGEWQLPRTFEPYYLNRILRGTRHGLSLFLVQTIAHAHGGQAVARRRPDGRVVLDLLLR